MLERENHLAAPAGLFFDLFGKLLALTLSAIMGIDTYDLGNEIPCRRVPSASVPTAVHVYTSTSTPAARPSGPRIIRFGDAKTRITPLSFSKV